MISNQGHATEQAAASSERRVGAGVRRRSLLLAVPGLAVAFGVAACGSENTPVADSTATAASTSSAATSASVSTAAWSLPATGQTTCYDVAGAEITCPEAGEALYGQDASFTAGAAMSFTDNGDETVTDRNTGLTWQKSPPSDTYTWQEGADYVEALELADQNDWRLPSPKELFSIASFASGWPYLDTEYFELAGEVTKDEQFWTSQKYVGTTVEGGENAAFGVNAVTGHIKAYAAEAKGPAGGKRVRAVRGEIHGENSLTDNGDGTITDAATALMWAQDDEGLQVNWEDALAHAGSASVGGYNDWRVPNVKELQSIVDYSRSPSATDASAQGPAIDALFTSTPMTNEAGDSDYGYYWTGTSANFTSGEPYYYAWYVAFGRAVNGEGVDFHGAGAVRFDTKTEDGPDGEGGERYTNFVRLVRTV